MAWGRQAVIAAAVVVSALAITSLATAAPEGGSKSATGRVLVASNDVGPPSYKMWASHEAVARAIRPDFGMIFVGEQQAGLFVFGYVYLFDVITQKGVGMTRFYTTSLDSTTVVEGALESERDKAEFQLMWDRLIFSAKNEQPFDAKPAVR